MAREFKGRSVKCYVKDYTVLDLETTSCFVSDTEIVEISAIKVRNGVVIDTFDTLVNPGCHIPAAATAVNHITDDMVKDAPYIVDVIEDLLRFLGDDVIVGYNCSRFDVNIIYDVAEVLLNEHLTNDYFDLLDVARRVLPELENRKLETISKYFGLDTEGEHRALKDCCLTKDCYEEIYKKYGNNCFSSKKNRCNCGSGHEESKSRQVSSETKALRELQSFLENIVKDGQVTEEEFGALSAWVEEHWDLNGNYPFDRVFDVIDSVMEDGIVSEKELIELNNLFQEFINPVKNNKSKIEFDLTGKHICITGEFSFGERKAVEKYIINEGAILDSRVKKATDYLVVGDKGSEFWKTGNFGSKIQRAMELLDKGGKIKIVEEKDFFNRQSDCCDTDGGNF